MTTTTEVAALDESLARACALANKNGPNPCTDMRDGGCLRRQGNMLREQVRDRPHAVIPEDRLCPACAVAWHVGRAYALFLAIQKMKGV